MSRLRKANPQEKKKTKKAGKGPRKGGNFERTICKRLSLWWSKGERDDIFWRTSGSGARATVRGKKGISTVNSSGDIGALDPIGNPFLELFLVEIKRGYPNAWDLIRVLDKPAFLNDKKKKGRTIFGFWEKANIEALSQNKNALLIFKRDRGEELVVIESGLFYDLKSEMGLPLSDNFIQFSWKSLEFTIMTLDHFLKWASSEYIKDMIELWKEREEKE